MTAAADLLLTDAEVHTLADPDEVHEAVAVRDGRIVRVGAADEVRYAEGVETRVVELGGRVLLPGFVDAHTHLPLLGRRLVHADLSDASSPDEAVARLRDRAAETGAAEGESGGVADGGGDRDDAAGDWILGFAYDESGWVDPRYLDRGDLDAVSEDRPVAAFREDMHVASLNGVALSRLRDRMPASDVRREGGDPTGVVVEDAADAVWAATEPGPEETASLVRAAQRRANAAGVTAVHDMVRRSHAPRAYRELDRAGELTLRVRLNYWADHLDAVLETGLRTNHGSEMVRVGAVKTFTDGTIGGRTAKVSEAYRDAGAAGADADGPPSDGGGGGGGDGDARGQWVVPPAALRELVARADGAGLQVAAHAIGDEAVREVVDAYAACDDPGAARHRVEHAELVDGETRERLAETGVVASMQPNFLKWAEEGGLYDARIGERRLRADPFRELADAGVRLAFGSDCMPLDPLFGVHRAVNAPGDAQRLTVTEALRAYTLGGAYAGFDEDRLGTVERGKRADFVALDASPWDRPDAIEGIDAALTVVDGEVVYDAREN